MFHDVEDPTEKFQKRLPMIRSKPVGKKPCGELQRSASGPAVVVAPSGAKALKIIRDVLQTAHFRQASRLNFAAERASLLPTLLHTVTISKKPERAHPRRS